MRSNTVFVAALAAAASVAAVETGRPRIYFPRQVKRQYTNATGTTGDTPVPLLTPLGQSTNTDPSLTDVVGGITGQTGGKASGSLTSTPGTGNADSDGASGSKVTTVIVAHTVVVPPTPSTDATPSSPSTDVTPSPATSPKPSGGGLTLFPTPVSSSNAAYNGTVGGGASTGSIPPIIVLPTLRSSIKQSSKIGPTGTGLYNSTMTKRPSDTSSTSSSGILLAPTGVVSSTGSSADPLGGLLSSIVGDVTSAINPSANHTDTYAPTKATSVPVATDPTIGLSLTLLPPGTGSSSIPSGTAPPTIIPTSIIPPPVTNATEGPTATVPPTGGVTSIPDLNSTATELPPYTTHPPTTIVTISPNTTAIGNTTIPTSTPPPRYSDTTGVTSISPTATVTVTQPWLPTTIVVDPTQTSTTMGMAPTSAVILPTSLPKAITPDSANDPPPEDTTLIQIGFSYGMNYPFVVGNSKAAAQIFQLLPQALSYAGGFPEEKVQMRKLIPLNTLQSLGYVTTLAIVTYPSSMVEALRMDVKIPSSPLYNHPEQLVYNLTQQINPAIDIILGSYPEDGATPSQNGESSATSTSAPNSDPFDNDDDSSNSSSSQRGATAGIAFGVVGVAAAYGAAMFVIARRYKRKKQEHRRTSSVSESSGMRTVGSPPLMGGALLSRDFSSYGALAGGVAGGRDSQGSGSGRSGGGNSARTAVISAPMAAENSLGWN